MATGGSNIARWRDRALRLIQRERERPSRQPSVPMDVSRPRLADWSAVLAALPDAAMLISPQMVVLDHNAKAADLFAQLAPGVALSAVSRNPDLLEGIGQLRNGAALLTVALNERVPVERTLLASLSRLPDSGETLIVLRDLSDAARIDRMRTDFVANASHELRTPLASIIGFIETLQGAAKTDPVAREKFLGVMADQAQRMKRLVDDLMRLSRIEMHSHVLPRDAVDLRGVLEDVRQSLSPLAEREGVALSVHGVDATILVQGDRDELVQVFQNLIHNAIRYGRKGGIVSVRMERETGTQTVRTSITDDGPGIAAYHLPRLTERFYRADPAASRAKDGTGLGLAIAKHIVQRHRGELEIRSELGKGSTFVVALPMPN
jgi:two-component system, OmpR family, phosphate regulon sensor histidine kinase PhoR